MRLVSHPNVVDLKAFFYSNGEKVGSLLHLLYTVCKGTSQKLIKSLKRKTKCTSISS